MAYITLNKNNFFNNLDIIAKQTKSKDKIALVLKDNAYGHGLLEISQMAKEYGIKKAVVKSYDEAMKIENYFEYILVLADYPSSNNKKIRYTINDINSIKKFPHATKVELKVDTGMHRNGIKMSELKEAMLKIKEQGLILEAVFTHHRSADELSSEWFWQNENFAKVKKEAEKLVSGLGFDKLRFHSCNSASLSRHVEFDEDMARVGISAYGCMQLPCAFKELDFKSVLSVYANKISSRVLKKGEAVGYGGTFIVEKDCVVSNYNFGYGDGFLRICSNTYLTPEAKKQVGRISMDNASFISQMQEILIFNDAKEMAKSAKTISYEVLTSLKLNIKREIV
ncbi:MAG: alanine racemase [Sulfurimonas sp.]|nr:alanine racemase [Sulfurimonas sp.]